MCYFCENLFCYSRILALKQMLNYKQQFIDSELVEVTTPMKLQCFSPVKIKFLYSKHTRRSDNLQRSQNKYFSDLKILISTYYMKYNLYKTHLHTFLCKFCFTIIINMTDSTSRRILYSLRKKEFDSFSFIKCLFIRLTHY